jgi:beta-lactamase class A
MKETVVRAHSAEEAAMARDEASMIVESNNSAANRLIDRIGVARLNRSVRALGLNDTMFFGHYSELAGASARGRSSTNDLAEAAAMLLATSRGSIPSERRKAQRLLTLMLQAKEKDLTDHAIPRSENVADKIGETISVLSDLSITNPFGATSLIIASICHGVRRRTDAKHELYRLTASLYWRYYDLYREEPEGGG